MDRKIKINQKGSVICVCIFVLSAFYYIWYCHSTLLELPCLSWFDQLPLADAYFKGEIRIRDLFSSYGEHGMLANNIIYLFNVIFFHGSTKFDVVLNDINVMTAGGIILSMSYKMLKDTKGCIAYIFAEAVLLFSPVQGSAGAMDTQVRLGLLFFLITMIYVDLELRGGIKRENGLPDQKHFYFTLILIVLSVNVFGTLYSFAGIPFVWAVIFVLYFVLHKKEKRLLVIGGTYAAAVLIYVMEYRLIDFMGTKASGDQGIFHNMIYAFTHPVQAVESLLSWCAGSVLGWAFHESDRYSKAVWMLAGAAVFLVIAYAVYLFFSSKMYEKTWYPLMCIVYSFGVFALVYLGRATGWEWFAGEWYIVHNKIALACAAWILGSVQKKAFSCRALCTACMLVLCTSGGIGQYYTIDRAPAVREYYENMQKYLFVYDKKEMPVDEGGKTPLLHSLEVTMDSIEILQKYYLSVYQYWEAYENASASGVVGNKIKFERGRYDDGWTEKECVFRLNTNGSDQIKVHYYALAEQHVAVFVNGEAADEAEITEGRSYFTIPCSGHSEICVELISDYEIQLDAPDGRVCSYILSEVERE